MPAKIPYLLNISFDDKEIAKSNKAYFSAVDKKWGFPETMQTNDIIQHYTAIKDILQKAGKNVSKLDATGKIEALIAERAKSANTETKASETPAPTKDVSAKNDASVKTETPVEESKASIESEKTEQPNSLDAEVVSIVDGKLNINQDILDNIKNKITSMNKNKSELRLNNAYNFSKLIMDNAKTMVSLAKNIGEYTVHGIRGIPGIDTLSVKEMPNAIGGYNPTGYSINLYKEAEKENSPSLTVCFYTEEDYIYDDNTLKNHPTDIFQTTAFDMAIIEAIGENGIKKNAFLTSYTTGVENVIKELRQEYEKSEQAKADTLSEEQEEEAFKG